MTQLTNEKVGESMQIDGQNPSTDLEAILSLDIAHPHIVQTYHYCSRPVHQVCLAAWFLLGTVLNTQTLRKPSATNDMAST